MCRTLLLAALTAAVAACSGSDPVTTPSCVPDCAARQCGDDGCGGSCGACADGQLCGETFQCLASCTPSCEGRACGGDGCGGSCGACPDGQACDAAFQCLASCAPSCEGRACGPDGCGGSCGTCPEDRSCDDAFQCVPIQSCTPSCTGRACGDDGCGGSCGTCPEGAVCGAAGACESVPAAACGTTGQRCLLENHVANEYACSRLAEGGWSCERTGVVLGTYGYYQVCRIGCAGGNSSCGHGDMDYVVECQQCEAGCVEPESIEACPGETPDSCPFPCACR